LVCGGLYEANVQGQPIFAKNSISRNFVHG
jgi:hypothetical protein